MFQLGDFAAAVLSSSVRTAYPDYDFQRAKGLLAAHAYARKPDRRNKLEVLFQHVRNQDFMSSDGDQRTCTDCVPASRRAVPKEARAWAQKILSQDDHAGYQRRRERPRFRKAYALLARLRLQA